MGTYSVTDTPGEFQVDLLDVADLIASATDLTSNSFKFHDKRVAYISKRIYEHAFSQAAPFELIIASLLHDIGIETSAIRNSVMNLFPDEGNLEKHSIDGELLLENVVLFSGAGSIIRNHHKAYDDIVKGEYMDSALYSNIINLADRMDVSIEYNSNILLQIDKVIKNILSFPAGFYDKRLVDALINLSENKSFWLDIINKQLVEQVIRTSVSRIVNLSCSEISQIADLCARMIDRKSPYTARHSLAVSAVSGLLGRAYNMDENKCFLLTIAGKLHDLGKLSIPEDILHKPDKLSDDEFRIIQQHTYYTYYIMDKVPLFKELKKWAAYHHENLDGSGYPFGLKGDEISLESRIISVADKLIALTEDRPYRKRKKKEEVLDILDDMVSRNWIDKHVVSTVCYNYEQIMDIL